MADADLFHLGKYSFQEKSDLLRQETELLTGKTLSGTEWRANTLQFMEGHSYFTEFAKQELEPNKQGFYKALREKQDKKLAKKAKAVDAATLPVANTDTPAGKPEGKKKKKVR